MTEGIEGLGTTSTDIEGLGTTSADIEGLGTTSTDIEGLGTQKEHSIVGNYVGHGQG